MSTRNGGLKKKTSVKCAYILSHQLVSDDHLTNRLQCVNIRTMMNDRTPQKEITKKRGYYTIGDLCLPAVTHIIGETLAKPALRYWYGKIGTSEANKIGAESRSFGSAMHKMVAEYLKTGQEPTPETMVEECGRAWKLWRGWWEDNRIESERVEETLYNSEYAGTADLIGEGMIVDWKFAGGLYDGNRIQMGAYANLVGFTKAKLVRVSKDEKNIEVLDMDADELKAAYKAFKGLKAVFDWREKK